MKFISLFKQFLNPIK